MKITGVEAIPLRIPFSYGGAAGRKLDFCLVRVETDAGLVGWGEAFSYNCLSATTAAVTGMIAPLALGQEAERIAELHSSILLAAKSGSLALPGLPGLGADPDPEVIRRYRI